jgi:hypothetical protein
MSQPAPSNEIAAALGALRDEAGAWQTMQAGLDTAARSATELGITAYGDTGVFDAFIAANNQLVYLVARHCTDARTTAGDIAQTLLSVATSYEADEAANLHTMQNID